MQMKRLLTLIALAAVICSDSLAYKLSVDSIPGNLREGATAVMRSDQMVFTVDGPGKGRARYRRVITLMNENAESFRLFQIYYDNFRTVQNIRAAVYDSKGKLIETIAPGKITDVSDGSDFISDSRLKRIVFPVNRYPFTIEVEYEVSFNSLLNLPQWNFHLDPEMAVEESGVQFVIPKDIPFRYREYYTKSEVDSAFAGDNIIYTWVEKEIPAINRWYFSPLATARRPLLLSAIDDFEFGGLKGSMKSWQSLGSWQWELNKGLDELPDAEKLRVQNIVSGISGEREKVKALYEYMQSRTRYVSIQLGIGGMKPFSAQAVSEKGYGDCKALSNYMYTILKEAGISSHYTLVKSGEHRNIISSFVSDQFDHIILCVPLKNDTVWLECTNQSMPFNYLGSFTSGREVLLVTPTGGKIVRTPGFSESYRQTAGTIQIDRREDSNGNVSMTARGAGFDENRVFTNETETEIKRILNMNLPLGSFSIPSASYKEYYDYEPWSELSFDIKMKDFAVMTGSRLHFRPCLQPFDYQPFDTVAVRIWDIPEERDSIVYRVPAGYEPEFIPSRSAINTPYGSYRSEIKKLEDGSVLYIRVFNVKKGIYKGPEAVKLFAFLNTAAEKDHQRLFLVRKPG